MSSKEKVIYIVGPTASGKTGLSVELAKSLDVQVVSADSMQIYKGMSIASAAPTKEEMQGVPHHLVEFVDFGESFTVAQYVKCAREKINEIILCGKTPLVVGGTGLYINSLADNIEFAECETDLSLREKLEAQFDETGAEGMLEKLAEFDPQSAKRLHPNNRRRIIRAFEVYELTGVTLSEQNVLSRQNESNYENIMIGITYKDRQKLYDRINKRVDLMLENGLLDEAHKAFLTGVYGSGATQAIGHKEFFPYFKGEISLEEATESLKQATRRYAKRQLTWFRRDERINWIYADEDEDMLLSAIKIVKGE